MPDSTQRTEIPTPASPRYSQRSCSGAIDRVKMHVAVNSADFGPIEVHTSLSQDRVGASISTGHADLREAMKAEMPSLNRAIEGHQLRLDHFDVGTRGGGQGGNASADHHQRSSEDSRFSSDPLRVKDVASAPLDHEPTAWITPHSVGLSVIA